MKYNLYKYNYFGYVSETLLPEPLRQIAENSLTFDFHWFHKQPMGF